MMAHQLVAKAEFLYETISSKRKEKHNHASQMQRKSETKIHSNGLSKIKGKFPAMLLHNFL